MNWRTVTKVPSSLGLAHHFLPCIRPGSRILDVGCGEAAVGKFVLQRAAGYFGVDVNLPSLGRASLRYPVAAAEGGRLPFRDGSFDLVMLRAVLTVLPDEPDLLSVLGEAFRVSRGKVGVQDFLVTEQLPLYQARYREGVAMGRPYGVFPVCRDGELLYWARHFEPDALRGLIARAGGRVEVLAEAPAPTRSGNVIRGVTLLACRADQRSPVAGSSLTPVNRTP